MLFFSGVVGVLDGSVMTMAPPTVGAVGNVAPVALGGVNPGGDMLGGVTPGGGTLEAVASGLITESAGFLISVVGGVVVLGIKSKAIEGGVEAGGAGGVPKPGGSIGSDYDSKSR